MSRHISPLIHVANPNKGKNGDNRDTVQFDIVKHLLTDQKGFGLPAAIADAMIAQGFDFGDIPHVGPTIARVGAIVRIPFTQVDATAGDTDLRSTVTDPAFLTGETNSSTDNCKNRMVYVHGGRVLVGYDSSETAAVRCLNRAGWALYSETNSAGGSSYKRYEGLPVYDFAADEDKPMTEFKCAMPVYWSEDTFKVKHLAVNLVGNTQTVLELLVSWHQYKDKEMTRPILSGCGVGESSKLGLTLALPFSSHLRNAARVGSNIRGFFGR